MIKKKPKADARAYDARGTSLSHVPTGLADGFGLREPALLAAIAARFTPGSWVPRFPSSGNSAYRTVMQLIGNAALHISV